MKIEFIASEPLQKTVVETFEICQKIGIAQIFPNILYNQVMKMYFIYTQKLQQTAEYHDIKFLKNKYL